MCGTGAMILNLVVVHRELCSGIQVNVTSSIQYQDRDIAERRTCPSSVMPISAVTVDRAIPATLGYLEKKIISRSIAIL